MFEELKKYKKIIVTGPQRSGTRIGTKMIAQDTGYEYIDESVFNVCNVEKFDDIVKYEENIVIQAPGMASYIEKYSAPDLLIVFMMRPLEDIEYSENRIGWGCNYDERSRYGRAEGLSREIKYQEWQRQKLNIMNWKEVEYDSLSAHPLWIEKPLRKDFKPYQTTV